MKIKDLTGKKLGMLTPLKCVGTRNAKALWLCRCDCGKETIVIGTNLRADRSRSSCGCMRSQWLSESSTTHGASKGKTKGKKLPSEYNTWFAMKQRCLSPSNPSFFRYGGRGIKVCERWLKFENFLSDMGARPCGTSLERINNDGDYEPPNCKWATLTEQANNRRNNRPIEYHGTTKNLLQWCRELNCSRGAIEFRLAHGITPEEAFETPCNPFKEQAPHAASNAPPRNQPQ